MKKTFLTLALCVCCASPVLAQKAKYVFYIIGDGMGLNQVNTTEFYKASVNGKLGIEPMCFASFPYTTFATSHSASSDVTDSAAGGTALSTGVKTKNGMLGMTPDTVAVNGIAYWAKQSGKKVGVCTSVSIDHATPAAFYAHQPNRNNYHEIGHQLAASGYDYFGGADFLRPVKDGVDVHDVCEKAGYTFAYGYEEAQAKWKGADKLILVQTKEAAKKHTTEIPYAIDREPGDLTLSQIVETGINVLSRNNKNGFFLMIEGGEIDHGCHANDAGTTIQEVLDMDEAIKVVYEFYKKHPKETLIIVTADHETGGMVPGNGRYELNLQVLQYQTCSVDKVSKRFEALKKSKMKTTWEDAKAILSECYGLFDKVPVSWRDEAELHAAYEDTFVRNATESNWYGTNSTLAAKGRDILNKAAMVSWASLAHSDGYIPVFAIGVGAENFHGRLNNIDIPEITAKIAGYKK